ncbi:MAG: hypothetical protein BGO05_27355 [Rhizobiales bacterium 63-7]|nr:hypothetical protein [Hyphomicrobiales bacterium]OJU70327.1 MAG: hypothetical protein BGO05_27355 [Rhizobiales bacterium 63-7]
MARYYFDVTDGEEHIKDEVGRELATEDDILREVNRIMIGAAGDIADHATHGRVSVSVRQEDGGALYAGSLLFSAKKIE